MGSGCKICMGGMNVNCVGIDVSKGKSMVAVMRPLGELVYPPFEVGHTDVELCELSRRLGELDGETRVVMEATGNYHLPIASFLYDSGFYVSVANAMLVHGYGNNSLRRATSVALAALRSEMQSLAASLPEYPVVMGMFGVGPALGPQLMAEIGDVRRFHSKKALVAFAGIDAPPYQSGQMEVRSRSISKRGSSALRRTLFLVMSAILRRSPADEPVYQFIDRKRAEGKPYRVYMMASPNKFLRIYFATVKQYLDSLEV